MTTKSYLNIFACLVAIVGCSREHTKNEVRSEFTLAEAPTSSEIDPSLDFDPAEIRAAVGAFRHIDLADRTRVPILATHVISNREELNKTIDKRPVINQHDVFRTALQTAPIDFSHEAMFLLQHTAGDPNIKVRWGIPTLSVSSSTRGRELRLRVHANHDGLMGAQMDVNHSFPVIVDVSKVDSVSLTIIRSGGNTVGESEDYVAYLNEENWAQAAAEHQMRLARQHLQRRQDMYKQRLDDRRKR